MSLAAYNTPADLAPFLGWVLLLLFFLVPVAILAPLVIWYRRRGERRMERFDAFLNAQGFADVAASGELIDRLAPVLVGLLGRMAARQVDDPFVRLARREVDGFEVFAAYVCWPLIRDRAYQHKTVLVVAGLSQSLPDVHILPETWTRVHSRGDHRRRVHLPGGFDEKYRVLSRRPHGALHMLVGEPIELIDRAGEVEIVVRAGMLAAMAAGGRTLPRDLPRFAGDMLALASALRERAAAADGKQST